VNSLFHYRVKEGRYGVNRSALTGRVPKSAVKDGARPTRERPTTACSSEGKRAPRKGGTLCYRVVEAEQQRPEKGEGRPSGPLGTPGGGTDVWHGSCSGYGETTPFARPDVFADVKGGTKAQSSAHTGESQRLRPKNKGSLLHSPTDYRSKRTGRGQPAGLGVHPSHRGKTSAQDSWRKVTELHLVPR